MADKPQTTGAPPELKKKHGERVKKSKAKIAKKAGGEVDQNRLKVIVTIVGRSKAEYYIDLLQAFEINMQLIALGYGTADASMTELFGLTDSEKAVICGVIQENKIPEVMRVLDKKFRTIKNGKGIAYTVPLSSVIGTLIFGFLSNNRLAAAKPDKDGKEKKK